MTSRAPDADVCPACGRPREPAAPAVGLELDLYAGVGARTTVATGGATPETSAPAPPSEVADWIHALWRDFPPAVRERYRPIAVLGEGGMGIVLEAEDAQLARRVAVKGPRDPAAVPADARDRLAHEARLHAKLTHPNILPVFDAWTDARGLPWCAMLRVRAADGDARPLTLAGRLALLPPAERFEDRPVAQLADIFLQVCRAVAHAHAQRVLHRDLKPDNVLLGPAGEALVADWGVARTFAPGESGQTADIVGTPGYAAPEQIGRAGAVRSDARSDVYSLGVVLFEMVSGKRPGPDAPLPLRTPRELTAIVRRATAEDPAQRFASVAALQAAVEIYLTGGMIDGLDYSLAERAVRRARARPGVAVALASAALFAVAALVSWIGHTRTVQLELQRARQNLALAHAGWAAAEDTAGRVDEARLYAAMAYELEATLAPDWKLPDGRVHSVFACTADPGPLVWAATLSAGASPVKRALFVDGAREMLAQTDAGDMVSLDLKGARPPSVQHLGPAARGSSVSVDGATAVVVGPDEYAQIWRRAGAAPFAVRGTFGPVPTAGALSPDGRTYAYSDRAGVVHLVSTEDSRGTTMPAAIGAAWVMKWARDGKLLAACDGAGALVVWDVPARRVRARCANDTVLINLGFSWAGDVIAGVGADDAILTWSTADGKPAGRVGQVPAGMTSVAFSPDGSQIAAGGADFAIHVWSRAGRELANLFGHVDGVWTLEYGADGHTLVSGSEDGSVRIWNVAAAMEARALALANSNPPEYSAVAPDGSSALFSRPGRQIARIDRATGATLARFSAPFDPQALALLPGGRALAATLEKGAGWFVDLAQPEVVSRFEVPPGTAGLALAPDRPRVALGGKRLVVQPLPAGPVQDLPAPAGVTALAFSADGQLLAAGARDGTVTVHTLDGSAPPRTYPLLNELVGCVAFDPRGEWIAGGTGMGAVVVAERASGRCLPKVQKYGPIGALAVAPGATRVAGGGPDAMHVWSLPDGRDETRLRVIEEPVWGVAFTPSGDGLFATRGVRPVIWELAAIADPKARVARVKAESFFDPPDGQGKVRPKPIDRAPRARQTTR